MSSDTGAADGKGKSNQPYNVVIIGASYGGLSAAGNLLDLCHGRPARFTYPYPEEYTPTAHIPIRITIIDERDGFFHTIGAPLALADTSYAAKSWVRIADIPALQHPCIKFIHGSACTVDPEQKTLTLLASGAAHRSYVHYDYLVVASGLRRAWPVVPQALCKREYMSEVTDHINKVKAAKEVVVIGGGAVGIEMAAEIKHIHPYLDVTLIQSRSKLLSAEPLPEQFKDQVLTALEAAGVAAILNTRVTSVDESTDSQASQTCSALTLSNGVKLTAGYVIRAISSPVPSTSFLPATALDKHGYVDVKPSLHFPSSCANAESHLAIGDITPIPGIKRCSTAMQMGHIAATNIHQQLLERILPHKYFSPNFMTITELYPGMGLAVGDTGLYWNPDDGIVSGRDALVEMFDDDLGFSKCWNYMQLGKAAK